MALSPGWGDRARGDRPQITRARSCWCSGARACIAGTACDHTVRKGRKATGQLAVERSLGGADDFVVLGRGTDGGLVVDRRAAK